MRLPSDRPAGRFVPLILAAALAATGTHAASSPASAPAAPKNGPAADYPVVIGDPYAVSGTSYTPEDKLNYDEVGYVAIDAQGGNAISGEHHTLPLPSYVEVTSLETGKTILVRIERRGPMDGTQLIGLSPGAAAQLGVSAGTAVRVRRVNPPEQERALLRAGSHAPGRIDTPMGLVNVLRRKLPGGAGALATASSTDLTAKTAPSTVPVPASTANVQPAPAAIPAATTARRAPAPQTVAAKSPPPLPPLESARSPASGTHPAAANVAKPVQPDFPWIATAQAKEPRQPAATPQKAATAKATAAPKAASPKAAPATKPPEPAATVSSGRYVVQAGAFSTRQRAQTVAKAIGGAVSSSGSLFRVRTGPFASRKEAEASLAKVHAAGYSDARIY